jgi:cbb3-type cytochrome oxidase subunit 3
MLHGPMNIKLDVIIFTSGGKNWAIIPLLLMVLCYKGLICFVLQRRRKHQADDEYL